MAMLQPLQSISQSRSKIEWLCGQYVLKQVLMEVTQAQKAIQSAIIILRRLWR